MTADVQWFDNVMFLLPLSEAVRTVLNILDAIIAPIQSWHLTSSGDMTLLHHWALIIITIYDSCHAKLRHGYVNLMKRGSGEVLPHILPWSPQSGCVMSCTTGGQCCVWPRPIHHPYGSCRWGSDTHLAYHHCRSVEASRGSCWLK